MSVFGINLGHNEEQIELCRLICENDKKIIICNGLAGTGKTFISLVTSLDLLEHKKFSSIVYTRDPVQVGHDMGFIPGDAAQKLDPFMRPLVSNLRNIVRAQAKCGCERKLDKHQIENKANDLLQHFEVIPIGFMRGDTLEDTILIVDEAQNLDLNSLKTVISRIGDYCKVILLGSFNQIDDWRLRKMHKCPFQKVAEALEGLPYVGYVELKESMRSKICVEVDNILGQIQDEDGLPLYKQPEVKSIKPWSGVAQASVDIPNDEYYPDRDNPKFNKKFR